MSGTLPVPDVPAAAQRMGVTFAYFDRLPGRWMPPTVVVVALLAAAATVLVPRLARRSPSGVRLLRVAAVGTVLPAVLGDGCVEVAKHLWLASYLLVVTVIVLAAGITRTGAPTSWCGTGRGSRGAGRPRARRRWR